MAVLKPSLTLVSRALGAVALDRVLQGASLRRVLLRWRGASRKPLFSAIAPRGYHAVWRWPRLFHWEAEKGMFVKHRGARLG